MHGDRSGTEVTRGLGWDRGSYCLTGMGVSMWSDDKVLKTNDGDSCTTLRIYLMPQNSTLKNG